MLFALALLPILLILFLMVGLGWGAARAGAAGYLSALLLAVLVFGLGLDGVAYAHAKALLLSLDVLLIIWAAFLLYRVVDEAGAIRLIGQALPHLTPDRGLQALIIGWVFASFLQGVGGFGVPVAVIAPLLVGLGFPSLAAVVIPSIGHGWAVTFGSMGSSFQALMAATGMSAAQLAPPAAMFLGAACFLVGFQVAHAAGGWQGVRRLAIPVLALAAVMSAVQYLVAVIAGYWSIGAFAGGLAGLALAFPLALRLKGLASQSATEKLSAPPSAKLLLIALSGYAILVAITLVVQAIPAVHAALGKIVISLDFPEIHTGLGYVTAAGAGRKIVLLRHTGLTLVYASLLAYMVYRAAKLYSPGAGKRILSGTLRRVMESSVSIVSMLTMAVLMEHAGMTDTLARGLTSIGGLFPLFSPWIGALGAWMTGSNTNSNVVFGLLQMRTAELLGYAVPVILAGQTAGAALASVMAPAKVVVGASTAGMAGREGEVMRRLIVYTLGLVLLISLLTFIFTR